MPETLIAAVGPGQQNREADVRILQRLLDRHAGLTGARLVVDGRFSSALERSILRFQRDRMRDRFASGIIRPGDNTFWQLSETSPLRILAGSLGGILLVPFTGNMQFDEQDYVRMGQQLNCEARAVKTVNAVESQFGPYDKQGRPSILFERHLFSQLTFRHYDGRLPSISNPVPGGYYFPDRDQYVRLQQAFALDRDAALKSCSWGGFQILGLNHRDAGYANVTDFVQAMCRSAEEQCDAFVQFIQSDPVRWKALREKDWALFASHYNGKYYYRERPPYDKRLEEAYATETE